MTTQNISINWYTNLPKKFNLKSALEYQYGIHRAGWSYALSILTPLHNDSGVFVDGFIESKFCWGYNEGDANNNPQPYQHPWVGFIHVPHKVPQWFHYDQAPQKIFQTSLWKESLKFCKGIFCLSNYQEKWLQQKLDVPIESLIHPTKQPEFEFDINCFLQNNQKRIVQIGWWLRKLHSIYYLPVEKIRKSILVKHEPQIQFFFQKEKNVFDITVNHSQVETINHLSNQEYDRLLSENLVYLDLYDASANNTIIECIARNTPILVNPLPAVKEYLGEDYPLYFKNREEAAKKAEDFDLVVKAHEYLRSHPIKMKIQPEYFLNSVINSKIYKQLQI